MAVQKKWKYANPIKKRDFSEYVSLPLDEKHKVVLKHWTFPHIDGDDGIKTICRSDVVELDGVATSKLIVIKSYAAVELLKKALSKKKSVKDTLACEVTRRYDNDAMEYVYDIILL